MGIAGWIGSVVLTVVVALGAAGTIRDKIVEGGWDRPRWLLRPLQRSARRAAARRVMRDAALIGSEFFEHYENAIDVAVASKRLANGPSRRPDEHLVRALQRWTIRLQLDEDFRGSRYYVNTMGAVCHSETEEDRFAAIMLAWIRKLQAANRIKSFDCLLALKEGNPILAHNVGRRLWRTEDRSVRPVFCKGRHDPARVSSPRPHETDFEGLRAFLDEPIARGSDSRYRALVIDDNCTSGKTLLDAIERFNAFVSSEPDKYPFSPIDTAVVLFVVKSDSRNVLPGSGIALHALLAVGEEDMTRINETPSADLVKDLDPFKRHDACEFSRTLGHSVTAR